MHFIGVANAFMANIAQMARRGGHEVVASDHYIAPRLRCDLEIAGIITIEGFHAQNVAYRPDLVIVGDGVFADNEEAKAAQAQCLPCISGAHWLEEHIVRDRWSKMIQVAPAQSLKKSTVTPIKRPTAAQLIKPRRIR